jgi:hypothetical protein
MTDSSPTALKRPRCKENSDTIPHAEKTPVKVPDSCHECDHNGKRQDERLGNIACFSVL